MPLTKEQFNALHEAITDAFDEDSLKLMLEQRLGFKLSKHVDLHGGFETVVHRLIDWHRMLGEKPVAKLVNAALESRPGR